MSLIIAREPEHAKEFVGDRHELVQVGRDFGQWFKAAVRRVRTRRAA